MTREATGVLGIDVGGTTIKGIRVSPDGEVLAEQRAATPHNDPSGELVVAAVADVVAALGGPQGHPVGIVVPGIVDEDRGIAVWSANVGFRDAPIRSLAEARLDTAIAFGQDVRAGALAEFRTGAASARDGSMAFVPIGTGVAAAFLVDGHTLVSGGWAGEIGQLVLTAGPHAGSRVEQISSASAIAQRAGEPDARAVAARVASGDAVAQRVWTDAIEVLADALAAIVSTVAPRTIVVGGGLASAGDMLLDPLRAALGLRIGVLRAPALLPARHGDIAAALGATYLATDLAARLRA